MKSALSEPQFHNEEAAFAYVEAQLWPKGPECRHCGETVRIGKLKGKTTRPGLYKCYSCRKPFTVRMGTVFESSHVPLRIWLQAIYLMCSSKKGISTRQLQRTFGGSMKTAWFLGHRIREAMTVLGMPDTGPLGGANQVVEADETYVGGKARNRKNRIPPKEVVLSLVERGGHVRSFHVPNVTSATLSPVITAQVDRATYLMTDESTVYPVIGGKFAGHGGPIHHGQAVRFEVAYEDGLTEPFHCAYENLPQIVEALTTFGEVTEKLRKGMPRPLLEAATPREVLSARTGHDPHTKMLAVEFRTEAGFPIVLSMTASVAEATIERLAAEIAKSRTTRDRRS